MKRITPAIAAGLLAAALSSCNHKELCFDHTHLIPVDVVFDWTNAPDADPESMAAYFYNPDGEAPQRFIFTDKAGGRIMVPYGDYMGLATNSDNTDWASTRNESDIETMETYTGEVSVLSGNGFDTRSIPRARAAEEERIISAPGMMWSARNDEIHLEITDTLRRVVFTPDEAVCHYTVIISDVENLRYVSGTTIDATISGMSEGYLHGSKQPTDTRATLPFDLEVEADSARLQASFLTFGESPSGTNPHYLTVYLLLTDGTKWYYTFDVSDQVHNAPDPHHVVIRLSGLKLPRPINHDGGFNPEVNDWQIIEVDLRM
ncbi:MAG: DUF5119 domain-containing protein [Paramuribaculum sp.]|nr:DUF5119 domain-containing protein [Paramuribaculum sp.]MDE7471363.1 DUF5119 domain-containing protein [Paramuribaculum sp.]